MDFARLKSSIALNATEDPSIYMALCMVESLFKDVEDATGADLSKAEPGDETLPTKMIWLARKLLKIYEENSQVLARNRGRLDAMMEKLSQTEQVLEELQTAEDRYQKLQREQSDMARRMAEAEEKKRACDALQAELEAAEQRLRLLSEQDPQDLQQQIQRQQQAADALEQQTQALEAEAQLRKTHLAELEAHLDQLTRNNQQADQMLAQLEEKNRQKESEREALRERALELETSLQQLNREHDEAYLLCAHYQEQKEDLQRELDTYRTESIEPLQAEYEALNQEQARLTEEREQVKELVNQARNARKDLVLNNALLDQELQRARNALQERQTALDQISLQRQDAEDRVRELEQEISRQTDLLAALQDKAGALEQEDLPVLRGLTDQAAAKKESLLRQQEELKQRQEVLTRESAELEQKRQDQARELDALNTTHAALTAAYTTSSEELQKLRQQLEELRGKNDKEKVQRLRQQLKADIAELENCRTEIADLDRSLAETRRQLEQEQAEYQRRSLQKQEVETAREKIAGLLRELEPYGSEELIARTEGLQQRLQTLQSASDSLRDALQIMRKTLGQRTDRSTESADMLRDQLQLFGKRLDQLQRALLNCADGIRLEEA